MGSRWSRVARIVGCCSRMGVLLGAAAVIWVEPGRCLPAHTPVDSSEPEVVPIENCGNCRAPDQCFEFYGGPEDNRDVHYQCCSPGTVATGETDPRQQRCAKPEVRGPCDAKPVRGAPPMTVTYCPGHPPLKVCCPELSLTGRQVRATCDPSPTAQQCREINLDRDGEILEEEPASTTE